MEDRNEFIRKYLIEISCSHCGRVAAVAVGVVCEGAEVYCGRCNHAIDVSTPEMKLKVKTISAQLRDLHRQMMGIGTDASPQKSANYAYDLRLPKGSAET